MRRRTRGSNVISLEGYRKVMDYFVRAGGNRKEDRIFHFSLMKIHIQAQNFPNLINVQDGIFQKINNICCMIIRETSS